MKSVAAAEAELRRQQQPHPYLPMEGLGDYAVQVRRLVFGPDMAEANEQKIASIRRRSAAG